MDAAELWICCNGYKTIPIFLEAHGKFREALFQVMVPDDSICETIAIFIKGDVGPSPGAAQIS